MPTSKEISERLDRFGDVVLKCRVHISKGIREGINSEIPKNVCALLNSGGGILQMANCDLQLGLQSKDLDLWWSGMENVIRDNLSGDDLCNYLDFVGYYDDEYFYLFVKSSEHLCTLNYYCRLPTETATHDVTHRSVLKLLSKTGRPGLLTDLPRVPREYYYLQTEESLKQEGKQIQFKALSDHNEMSQSLPKRISCALTKYITAFANHEGGHVYFGIEDQRAEVEGEELSTDDEEKTVCNIQRKMSKIIWGSEDFKAEMGKHWDINFYPVFNAPYKSRRMVVVVSVCKFPGGVFTFCPESYRVDAKEEITQLTFEEWKLAMLQEIKDKPELHNRFTKINIPSPFPRLVFGLGHTIKTARNKLLKCTIGINAHPRHVLDTLPDQNTKTAVKDFLFYFQSKPHLIIDVHSWGFGLPFLKESLPEKLMSLLVFSVCDGVMLLTFVKQSVKDEEQAYRHCRCLAYRVKQRLVHHGGSCERIAITIHLVDLSNRKHSEKFRSEIAKSCYPSTFSVDANVMDKVLDSVFIALAAYQPHEAETKHEDYYFLLTLDQFELMWTHQFTKELWIHGPPASGKTVSALTMMRELSRRGCDRSQILYVAENQLLCLYIRSFDICLVASRRELMYDNQNPETMLAKYGRVCNVFIDEAQNFKDRDGDWYGCAERLILRNSKPGLDTGSGYFWMFMDYAQKVHKFKAGIPSLIGKNNFMLREICRTSKEIFEYASKFMDSNPNPEKSFVHDSPVLGHEFNSGQKVNIIHCDEKLLSETLSKVLVNFTSAGRTAGDLAILTGKKKEAERIQEQVIPVIKESGNHGDASRSIEGVTVESLRRFSGLDRPVIIGLDPKLNEEHADLNKYLVNLATRAKDGLVIITTSKDLLNRIDNNHNHV